VEKMIAVTLHLRIRPYLIVRIKQEWWGGRGEKRKVNYKSGKPAQEVPTKNTLLREARNARLCGGVFVLCRRRLRMRRSVFHLVFIAVGVVNAPIFEVKMKLTPTRH